MSTPLVLRLGSTMPEQGQCDVRRVSSVPLHLSSRRSMTGFVSTSHAGLIHRRVGRQFAAKDLRVVFSRRKLAASMLVASP